MTKALAIRTDAALSTTDPLQLWDEAVGCYLETRKSGPEGNTAKTYGRTLRAYKDFALESGLSPWAGDAIIAYNKLQNGLRKADGRDLANDPIAARSRHVQAFFRWAHGYGLAPLTPEIVKDILDKPQVKQLSPRDIPDPKEVKAMLKAAESPREHALIRVLADAGLRMSEAISLTPKSIYLSDGKWWVEVRGKGDKSRDVEISEDLAQELLALKVADYTST